MGDVSVSSVGFWKPTEFSRGLGLRSLVLVKKSLAQLIKAHRISIARVRALEGFQMLPKALPKPPKVSEDSKMLPKTLGGTQLFS